MDSRSLATLLGAPAGLALLLAAATAPDPGRPRLIGLTTGNTAAVSGELVQIEAADGETRPLATIGDEGGHGSPSDLVRARDGKGFLVAQLEIGDEATLSRLQHVDGRTGKVRRLVEVGRGVLDSLAWDAQGHLLATWFDAGVQTLIELDPATGERTEVGPLQGTFLRSLAFTPDHKTLYGLQTAGATWPDALLSIDRADGTITSRVELELPEAATALEVAADGAVLVLGAGHTLFEVDPKSGAGKARGRTGNVLVVGLEPGPSL